MIGSCDRILASLQNQPDQSRDQLMQSANLTYDQVHDQTRNLCIEGLVFSHIGTRGERRYSLRTIKKIKWMGQTDRKLLVIYSK